MSARIKKLKKTAIPFIALAVLAGQLAGCSPKAETVERDVKADGNDEISLDEKENEERNGLNLDGKEYTVDYADENNATSLVVEELPDMPAEDMYKLFEEHYNNLLDTPEEIVRVIYGENANTFEEMHIAMELAKLNDTKATKFLGYKIPDNLNDLYIEWRESYVQNEIQVEDKAVEPFDAVDEIVYAVSDVNIRGFYNIESEKKGLLSYGQSIRRIGIGTGEVEGWSKVLLDDGSAAYIKSDYLSTSKPAVKSSSRGTSSNGDIYYNGPEEDLPDIEPTGREIYIDPNKGVNMADPNGDYTDNNDYSDLTGLAG